MTIGIVGASGYIGYDLYRYIKKRGDKVLGTYCNNVTENLVRFNLREDDLSIFDDCSYVVVASGYSQEFCELNKIEAYWLNVYRTKALLAHLDKKGIPALFISSEKAVNPKTVYGQYKRKVEMFIDKKGLNANYIRPEKVEECNIKYLCEEVYDAIELGLRKKAKRKLR